LNLQKFSYFSFLYFKIFKTIYNLKKKKKKEKNINVKISFKHEASSAKIVNKNFTLKKMIIADLQSANCIFNFNIFIYKLGNINFPLYTLFWISGP